MPSPPIRTIPRLADLDLVLRTPRLVLRPIAESDAEAMWPYVSDPEFPRMMTWSAHRHRDETVSHLRGVEKALAEGSDVVWALTVDGAFAGCIGLHGIQWQVRAMRVDRAELGYWVAPPHWGRGLCTEATRAVVGFGFAALGLHKVMVGCFEEKDASRRVIEKVGFRFLSVRPEHSFREGRWWSHRDYELTVDEWRATTVP